MVRHDEDNALERWTAIPDLMLESIRGLDAQALDLRREPDKWSIGELVHHLIEAQVIATSIVVAALGSPGCTYDWSWMLPGGSWMERLGYRSKPLDNPQPMLRALNAYTASLAGAPADGLAREVYLRDAPDAELRKMSVAEVLLQEFRHAEEHVEEIRKTRQHHRV